MSDDDSAPTDEDREAAAVKKCECDCECCADLLVRLRRKIKCVDGSAYPNSALFEEAADEIERLRKLTSIPMLVGVVPPSPLERRRGMR